MFAWGFGQSLYSLAITITVLIFCKGGRQTIAMKRKICLAQLLQGRCDEERGGDVTTAPHSPPSLGGRRHRSRRLAAIPSAASVVRPGLNAPPTSPTSLSPGGVTGSSSQPVSLPTRPTTRPARPLADAYGRALSLPVAAMREAGEATGGEEGEGHHQEAQRLPAARGDSLSTRRSARSSYQFGSTCFLLSEFHL